MNWYNVGWSPSDDGGSWRFTTNAGEDLIAIGLTYVRVTDGDCETSPDAATVYEAQLSPTQAGDQSWGAKLQPIGAVSASLPALDPSTGDVYLIPRVDGSEIDAVLDGIPPDEAFSICLRQP